MASFKTLPCRPTMVDARDAIVAADSGLNGGANRETIWRTFARHGLGYSARAIEADNFVFDGAGDLPADLAPGNRHPSIISQPAGTPGMGQTWTYQIFAEDLDGDALTYFLMEGPEGMTVNAAGLVEWEVVFASSRAKVKITVCQCFSRSHLYSREGEWGIKVFPEQRVQVSPNRLRVTDICVVAGADPQEQIFTRPPFLCIEIRSPGKTPCGTCRSASMTIPPSGCPTYGSLIPEQEEPGSAPRKAISKRRTPFCGLGTRISKSTWPAYSIPHDAGTVKSCTHRTRRQQAHFAPSTTSHSFDDFVNIGRAGR